MALPRLALNGEPPPTPPATAKDLKVWLDEEDMLMGVFVKRCDLRSGVRRIVAIACCEVIIQTCLSFV